MAQRRGFIHPNRSQSRRLTDWGVGPGGVALQGFSSSASAVLGAGIQPTGGKFTLVRTRGEFLAYLTSCTNINDGFIGAFGIGLATAAAFGAGIGSLPTPIDEAHWDGWVYHRFFALVSPEGLSLGAGTDVSPIAAVSASVRFEVDSKAMRKMEAE